MTDFSEIDKRFEDLFVADGIKDCIPKENWKEMKEEIFSLFKYIYRSGAEAAIEATRLQEIPLVYKEHHHTGYIRRGYNYAVSDQQEKAKEFLEKVGLSRKGKDS